MELRRGEKISAPAEMPRQEGIGRRGQVWVSPNRTLVEAGESDRSGAISSACA